MPTCGTLQSETWRLRLNAALTSRIGSSPWKAPPKPRDYYESILRLGELDVLPADFAKRLAPLAGFRNILVHEYLVVDWDKVYRNLLRAGIFGYWRAWFFGGLRLSICRHLIRLKVR